MYMIKDKRTSQNNTETVTLGDAIMTNGVQLLQLMYGYQMWRYHSGSIGHHQHLIESGTSLDVGCATHDRSRVALQIADSVATMMTITRNPHP